MKRWQFFPVSTSQCLQNFVVLTPRMLLSIRPAFGQKNHDLQNQVFQDEPRDQKKNTS